MPEECLICCEVFNKSNKKKTECNFCNYNCCRECMEKFILMTNDHANCMNCKKVWTRDMLLTNFTKKFVNENYKSHRENILFEREKALMPATQEHVERVKKSRVYKKKIEDLDKEYKLIYKKINEDIDDIAREIQLETDGNRRDELIIEQNNLRINHTIEVYKKQKLIQAFRYAEIIIMRRATRNQQNGNQNAESRQYVRTCPVDDCKGFVNKKWICGLCESKICEKCHEVINKDEEEEHECNNDNVETAKMLMKDTKPCPKCAVLIFKIEGCFARNTPILMWNGTVKMSQDINIGDELIGDDGHKRIVNRLMTGEDNLYEIIQNNGSAYTVNSKHKLVLQYINQDINPLEITVDDYLKLSDEIKKTLVGYKCDIFNKNKLFNKTSTISVNCKGKGIYYGWEIDNNKRFILSDFTVVRNCDQMWCTACMTPFSWRTGEIVTNAQIHNPHYYEFMNREGNAGPRFRNLGDQICGGLVPYHQITAKIKMLYPNFSTTAFIGAANAPGDQIIPHGINYISNIHRLYNHIEHTVIRNYAVNIVNDNLDLRTSYMLNEITEKEFKSKLQQYEKSNEKKNDTRMLLEMYQHTTVDIIRKLDMATTIKNMKEISNELVFLKDYFNTQSKKIGEKYKSTSIYIRKDWYSIASYNLELI
jgi:hypothetical protein